MRTKNILKTFLYGLILTFIIAILGLVKTKVLLDRLGEEYVGAYQLFTQLFTYLSLVEGGIGASIAFHLYAPLHQKDHVKANAIFLGARKYFRIIGIIIICLGVLLSLGIMFLIKETSIPSIYIRVCFILFVISSALNYFTSAHAILYEAEQKLYKSSNLNHLLSICESIAAIIIAMLGGKLLTILLVFLFMSILKNIILVVRSRKDHRHIVKTDENIPVDMSFKKEANNLVVTKISSLMNENIDILILSAFIGLKSVVIYTAYNQIINMIVLMVQRLNSALLPSVGNLLVAEKDKARETFVELNSLLFFIGSIIFVPLYYMLTPFIGLWYGEEYTVSNVICLLFVIILYINIIKISLESYIKAAGEFKSVRNCSIFQSLTNLVLSLVLVWHYGIGGVLAATVFSFVVGNFVNFPRIISRKIINDKTINYYKKVFKYLLGLVINLTICYFINSRLQSGNLFMWALNGFILFLINLILTFAFYWITKELTFLKRIKLIAKNFKAKRHEKN